MGSFLNRVRKNKVPSPTATKWFAELWQKAFDAAAPHDEQDRALFAAGNWFARMLESHRTAVPELSALGLTSNELVRAAIAGVNRNWIIANAQLRSSGKPGDVVVSEHLMSRRLTIQPWNIEVDPDGLMEAAVDSIRHVVFSSAPAAANRASVDDILRALLHRSIVSSAYLTLEALWKDCLWNAWGVFDTPDVDVIRPSELREALVEAVATFRGQNLHIEHVHQIERTWKRIAPAMRTQLGKYKVVREVRGTGRQLQIVTGQRHIDEVPGAFRLEMMGADPWVDHLVRQRLPKLGLLTLELLYCAWDFLATLAAALVERMSVADTGVPDLTKLWTYAPALDPSILSKALMGALDIKHDVAQAILDVFTMGPLKDADSWLTPIWTIADRFYVVTPVALTSNPRRLLDHWLTLGGIDLSIRGPLFEAYVRGDCTDSIEMSPVIRDTARCASTGIKLDPTIGDMDLVAAIGNTVLVGEIKCTTVPASPVDRSNYYDVLHEAAEQVQRKMEHSKRNVDALMKATGWRLTAPNFLGVIVTNQAIGVGQLINGVPVVDHHILAKYFGSAKIEHGVTFSDDGQKEVMRTTKFYRTAGEAERNLENYLRFPPQLRTGLLFVKPTETPLLTMNGMKPAVQRDFVVQVPPL